MTLSDPGDSPLRPAGARPGSRRDTRRPPAARTRRGQERRPYPTAATTSRTSRPRTPRPAATASRRTTQPIPATVWTAGPDPIDPTATWPIPIICTIVTSFSRPGDRIAILPWPTHDTSALDAPTHRGHGPALVADQVIGRRVERPPATLAPATSANSAATDNATELAAVLYAIDRLDRRGCLLTVPATLTPGQAQTRPASPSEGADPLDTLESVPTPPADHPPQTPASDTALLAAGVDLVITSVPARLAIDTTVEPVGDQLAWEAARLLRTGGILAVLTHCDWSSGHLVDPTGRLITAAQNADLLYLQHIVVLHTPIRHGALTPPPTDAAIDIDADAGIPPVSATPPAPVLPAARGHRRVHADVVVFAAHHPTLTSPIPAPHDEKGVGR